MNNREQARTDMIKRVVDFGADNATDYTTPQPPAITVSPGQTQAQQLFADLGTPTTGLLAEILANATQQQTGTGSFRGGTTSKSVLRDALMLELRGINRTAAAIADATATPSVMDSFRMPHGTNDPELVARASAFADAATPMTAQFVAYGHDATFVTDLRSHISNFGSADTSQNVGEQNQVKATTGFGPLLEEALTKVKQLDAFMHQFYKSDADTLGVWKTASHVERQAQAKKATTKDTSAGSQGSTTPPKA